MSQFARQIGLSSHCVQILGHANRKNGLHHPDSKGFLKRATKECIYLERKTDNREAKGISVILLGLPKGQKEGIMSKYQIRADHELGIGKIAVRKIACFCDGCTMKSYLPLSERYIGDGEECALFPIMQGLNKWYICQFESNTKKCDVEEFEETKKRTLAGGKLLSSSVNESEFGAHGVPGDPQTHYYICQWIGKPYELEKKMT